MKAPHVLVRASAGSGKTYRLTSAYLDLLARGASPSQVLATTFTRKAAGEIAQRVLCRLAEEANKHPAQLPALVAFTRQLHRVNLGTMDSLFHRIASGFRHELGLPHDPQVVGDDDPAARQLRLNALDATLTAQDADALVAMLRRLMQGKAVRSVSAELDRVVRLFHGVYREAPHPEPWHTLDVPPSPLDDEGLIAHLARLREAGPLLPLTQQGRVDSRWAKAWTHVIEQVHARSWAKLMVITLMQAVITPGASYLGKPIPPQLMDLLLPLAHHAQHVLLESQRQRIAATYDLLTRYDQQERRIRRLAGVLRFSDITHQLADELAVEDPSFWQDLYYRLDARFDHVLFDEFQDTSPAQWRVLRPVAEEIASHADGSRSLFVVGDVKQAIYGWRGGQASIFNRLQADLPPQSLSIEHLATSYRSSQVVLDAVDRVFGSLDQHPTMASDALTARAWARGYQPHTAHHRDQPGYVTVGVTPQPGENEDPKWFHAQAVAAWLAGEQRGWARVGASVGVLLRSNEQVEQVLEALRAQGVSASGEGGGFLSDDPAVALLLSALQLADHPGDSAAAFHLRHSPLASLLGMERMSPPRVSLRLRERLMQRGLGDVLMDWSRALAPACDARSLTRLLRLVALADGADPTLAQRPGRLIDLVHTLRTQSSTRDAVRVMTIHQAKGLQFDVVVLPGLVFAFNGQSSSLMVTRDGEAGPVTGVFHGATKEIMALSAPWSAAAAATRAGTIMDGLSTLYVAMTRARCALHLWLPPVRRGERRTAACAQLVREVFGLGDFEGSYASGDPRWMDALGKPSEATPRRAPVEALPTQVTMRRTEHRRAWPRVAPSGQRRDVASLLGLEGAAQRERGTAVHAALAQVEWLEGEEPVAIPLAAPVAALLRRPNEPVEALWRERGFAMVMEGALVQGVFDRVVVTADGVHLIDFKTGQVDVAAYRAQMGVYARALKRMFDRPVRATLAFVDAGQAVDVDGIDRAGDDA